MGYLAWVPRSEYISKLLGCLACEDSSGVPRIYIYIYIYIYCEYISKSVGYLACEDKSK